MDDLQKQRRMAGIAVVAWLAQAFYVLFPFDLVPDFLPIIGWIDDLIALIGLGGTTIWMVRLVNDVGLDRLLGTQEAPVIVDSEPYEPIPTDVLKAL